MLPLLVPIAIAAGAQAAWNKFLTKVIGEGVEEDLEKNRPQKTYPDTTSKCDGYNFQFIFDSEGVNLSEFETVNEEEAKEWRNVYESFAGGKALEGGLNAFAYDGLLKSNIPYRDLCKVAGDSDAVRGFVSNGHISKQAEFTKVGISNIAPLLVFQCLSAITSQYYMNIIFDKLSEIKKGIDSIKEFLEAKDEGIIKGICKRVNELVEKKSYVDTDKKEIASIYQTVDSLKEQYKSLLSKIDLNFKSNFNLFSAKKSANEKVNKLNESKFFKYFEIALQLEVLGILVSLTAMKIDNVLLNKAEKEKSDDSCAYAEDIRISANRIYKTNWQFYRKKFDETQYNVMEYIKLVNCASFFPNDDDIEKIKKELNDRFKTIEGQLTDSTNILERKVVQYIKLEKDGTVRKCIRTF